MLPSIMVFGPFAAAVIAYCLGRGEESGNAAAGKRRDLFAVCVTFLELALAVILCAETAKNYTGGILNAPELFSWNALKLDGVFTAGLSLETDGFRAVYALVTAVLWAFTTLFSLDYFKNEREHLSRYFLFNLMTLGATMGVMLSGDMMTTYLFFEILSLTSFTWVMHEETEGAINAGYTYLFIAIIGGLVCFMGLALLQDQAGTLAFDELPEALRAVPASGKPAIRAAAVCILLGFGCKAGMFPVHVWLPKAHPVAPAPASALLSGILTKVGIYGILMTTVKVMTGEEGYGWLVLILGTITMFLGAVLALFSVNLKRTLACSSMSQIGFILVGTAMFTILTALGDEEGANVALSGTMLHMVNHSLLKLSLFCAAGVVVMNIEELELNKIRGFGRNKLLLKIAFFLGLVGIGGVPLFNGYASKTLLHEGITAGIHFLKSGSAVSAVCPASAATVLSVIEWIFLISGGCTLGYMLKLFICVFIEKNEDPEVQKKYDSITNYWSPAGLVSVFGSSLFFVILGIKPVFTSLGNMMTGSEVLLEVHPFSLEALKGGCISLAIGLVIYLVLVRHVLLQNGRYVNLWPEKLDLENLFYRPLLMKWLPGFFGAILSVFGENKILRPVCHYGLRALSWIARFIATGPDALIALARGTFAREVKPRRTESSERVGRVELRVDELSEAAKPIVGNFSFALMLACVGIVVILIAMLLMMHI